VTMTPESMRDASDEPTRELSRCQCCGTQTVIAVEGVFRIRSRARPGGSAHPPVARPPTAAPGRCPRQRQLSSQAADLAVSAIEEVMRKPNDHAARSVTETGVSFRPMEGVSFRPVLTFAA